MDGSTLTSNSSRIPSAAQNLTIIITAQISSKETVGTVWIWTFIHFESVPNLAQAIKYSGCTNTNVLR